MLRIRRFTYVKAMVCGILAILLLVLAGQPAFAVRTASARSGIPIAISRAAALNARTVFSAS